MKPDTGESTVSINRRADDAAWPKVEAALRQGATLVRPARLTNYYVDHGQGPTGPSLTRARVKRLEASGVIRFVGVDRYGLTADAHSEPVVSNNQTRGEPHV